MASTHRATIALTLAVTLLGTGITVTAQRGQGRPGGPPPFGGPPPGGRGRGPGGGRPMPVPESNPLTPEKIALGRTLFFNPALSADRTVSCATCHQPDRAFTDGRAVARGIHGVEGTRNTPSLVNVGYGRVFFWDGRADSLEAQVMGPMTNPKEMGLSEAQIEARTSMKASDVAAALASYVRTIKSSDSRFDWFQSGQPQMLTERERAGFELFRGRAQCATCHGGPDQTDNRFHNTGVGWANGTFADEGRFSVSGDDRDHGAFKTPSLRDVALTAPYMHDGSLATLEAVVKFYSDGGRRNPYQDPRMRPLGLTADEQQSVVAFLGALTGRPSDGLGLAMIR